MIILQTKFICFQTKIHVSFVGSEFSGSHCRLRAPSYTFTCFHCLTHMYNQKYRGFHPKGIYPYLLLPGTYFHFHVYNQATLLDAVPPYRNTVLIITMHSHSFHAMSPCICNAMCHFMPIPCHIYDECYMDNSTHAYHPCIMDNYINQHKISKRSHISCQYICTHIYQHQQVITNQAMTYFVLQSK